MDNFKKSIDSTDIDSAFIEIAEQMDKTHSKNPEFLLNIEQKQENIIQVLTNHSKLFEGIIQEKILLKNEIKNITENQKEIKHGISTVSDGIISLSERVETQEHRFQQLQSLLDEKILKINDRNAKLQSQNTILFLIALFLAALAATITAILI